VADVLDVDVIETEAPAVPVGDTPSEPSTVTPCKCGAGPHSTDPRRCMNGHQRGGVDTGQGLAFKHGADGFRTTGKLPPEVRLTVSEFIAHVIADRGGESELSTLEKEQIRKLAEIDSVARLLSSIIADNAKEALLAKPRGLGRNTPIDRWVDVLNTWLKFAKSVGLTRRARTISLHDYLMGDRAPISEDPQP
jgi:hypothetical protein